MKSWTTLALSGAICFATACGDSGGGDVPQVDCNTGTVPKYSEIKSGVLAKCTNCHSSALSGVARVDAPANVNFDTFAAAKAEAKQAAIEVNAGAMPPKGFAEPSADEKSALYKWALCGTPE